MSGPGSRPVGKVTAMVKVSPDGPTKYVELGPVWRTRSGKLIFTMDVEPLAWKDPFIPRTILITTAEETKPNPAPPSAPSALGDEFDYDDGCLPF